MHQEIRSPARASFLRITEGAPSKPEPASHPIYGPIMRVLLTGACGFIGSHAAAALTAAGHEVIAVDALLTTSHATAPTGGTGRSDPPYPVMAHPDTAATRGLPPDVGLITADVRDAEAMRDALRGVDLVCHQAAMVGLGVDFSDAPGYVGCNDFGTAVLLAEMARARIRGLVLASSMVVYGEGRYECDRHGIQRPSPRTEADLAHGRFEPVCGECGASLRPGLVGEDAPLDPRNVYAATKVAQEHLAASWARVTGGSVAALRYHNVYGPRMPRDTPYAGVAAIFRSTIERGEAPMVFEDGGQWRDFVHVRDVADANVAALSWCAERPATSELRAFNVGSGTPHTVGELAAALSAVMAGPEPFVTGGYRLGDVRHITASSERAHAELDWYPRVSFDDGIAEFAAAVA
jgi:dTDP-L-rhamnose 4-epimerase